MDFYTFIVLMFIVCPVQFFIYRWGCFMKERFDAGTNFGLFDELFGSAKRFIGDLRREKIDILDD